MKNRLTAILVLIALAICVMSVNAENIDPQDTDMQYAWGENVGWVNFQPGLGDGAQVSSSAVTGFVWSENVGWINLSPSTFGGVENDGAGNLSGFAWGENVGWINFQPQVPGDVTEYGVKINANGEFSGWAWGENVGWINFGIADNYIVACKVNVDHLAGFVAEWLAVGPSDANLDGFGNVDISDFAIIASFWLDFCPDEWPL